MSDLLLDALAALVVLALGLGVLFAWLMVSLFLVVIFDLDGVEELRRKSESLGE